MLDRPVVALRLRFPWLARLLVLVEAFPLLDSLRSPALLVLLACLDLLVLADEVPVSHQSPDGWREALVLIPVSQLLLASPASSPLRQASQVPQASPALLDSLLAALLLRASTPLLDDERLYASSTFCDTHARNLVQIMNVPRSIK